MSETKVTRLTLHNIMLNYSDIDEKKSRIHDYLKQIFSTNNDKEAEQVLVKYTHDNFFCSYFKFWKKCFRSNKLFLKKHQIWLSKEFSPPCTVLRCLPNTSSSSSQKHLRGRPLKEFDDCTDAVKRKKTENLRQVTSTSELTYATALKLRAESDIASAKLLMESRTTSPTRSKRILEKWKKPETNYFPSSLEEALSLIISLNLSKSAYNILRSSAISHKCDLYPSYYKIIRCKEQFYPENIIITENICEVPLQNLLNKTCESIIRSISPQTDTDLKNNLILHCKWGFDGSSGYSIYKQKSETEVSQNESVFVTSLVPLRLVDISGHIIWKNYKSSSTRFCRPIRIQWIKESEEVSKKEEQYITNQISALSSYHTKLGMINFSLLLTMIDGKVCNALSGASGMRCYICGATISQMNNLKYVQEKTVNLDMCKYGLSILHAYIRFFECFLHISYRLDIKLWKVEKKNREIFEQRKKLIQDKFRKNMGLIVDVPKPGYGTSNDGNTARRFFANPSLSAEITGIDEDLIKRCAAILTAINSGYEIKLEEFEQYCLETAKRYIALYDWYYMPTSMHKILIHGSTVIKDFILPIGQLSEEAQEAKNKHIRYYREHHTRKYSSLKTNEDLFRRLILSSDPYLSSFAHVKKDKKGTLDSEVLKLINVSPSKIKELEEESESDETETESLDSEDSC